MTNGDVLHNHRARRVHKDAPLQSLSPSVFLHMTMNCRDRLPCGPFSVFVSWCTHRYLLGSVRGESVALAQTCELENYVYSEFTLWLVSRWKKKMPPFMSVAAL